MSHTHFSLSSVLTLAVSSFIFLFFTLALVIPSGYSYGAVLLVLTALRFLFVRPYPEITSSDVLLILALTGYFLVCAFFNVIHQQSSRSFDNPARFLLAVPVLLLLLRVKVKMDFTWIGLAIGAMGALTVALWNIFAQGEERASGHTNAIQFGDIAMLFSCLLLSSIHYFAHKKILFKSIIIAGIISGIVASIFSGSRGGWLALGVTVLWLYTTSDLEHKRVKMLTTICAVLIAIVVFYQFPQQGLLQSRVQDAVSDLQRYQLNHDVSTSIGSRLHMWQRSVELISVRPLSGWGTQERAAAYLASQGESDAILNAYHHVHNDLLDATLKRGLLGGAMLIVLYVIPLFLFYRNIKTVSLTASAFAMTGVTLVLCVTTFGMTQTFFSHASGCTLYAFLLVILWASMKAAASQNITDNTARVVDTAALVSAQKGQ